MNPPKTRKRQKHVAVINPDDELRLLRIEEVALLAGVSELTVMRYVRNKKLRCVRFGRATRFQRQDVKQFIHGFTTTGPRKRTK